MVYNTISGLGFNNVQQLCKKCALPESVINELAPIGKGDYMHVRGCLAQSLDFNDDHMMSASCKPVLSQLNEKFCPVDYCQKRIGSENIVLSRGRHFAKDHTVDVTEGKYKGRIKCNIDPNCDTSFPGSYLNSSSKEINKIYEHVKKQHPESLI